MATNLGRNKTGYRTKIVEYWSQVFPNLKMTSQWLADQVKQIMMRKSLSEAKILDIKNELVKCLYIPRKPCKPLAL